MTQASEYLEITDPLSQYEYQNKLAVKRLNDWSIGETFLQFSDGSIARFGIDGGQEVINDLELNTNQWEKL